MLYFSRILSSDPCVEGNYEIVAGQAQRSFNHHLSVGNLAPVCDSKLLQGWYRYNIFFINEGWAGRQRGIHNVNRE